MSTSRRRVPSKSKILCEKRDVGEAVERSLNSTTVMPMVMGSCGITLDKCSGRVIEVEQGGCASERGIRKGWQVISVRGTSIKGHEHWAQLGTTYHGKEMEVSFRRKTSLDYEYIQQ